MTEYTRRRSDREQVESGAYSGGERRYYDRPRQEHVSHLHIGDCVVTDRPDALLITILGSCVAACVRDAELGIGGMNHFLLPDAPAAECSERDALRYGSCAMPHLMEAMLARGARRERMEWKFFGGANVLDQSLQIGTWNVTFIHAFLEKERLQVAGQDLGGSHPRRILYYPDSGKAMVRNLRRKEDISLVHAQIALADTMKKTR